MAIGLQDIGEIALSITLSTPRKHHASFYLYYIVSAVDLGNSS